MIDRSPARRLLVPALSPLQRRMLQIRGVTAAAWGVPAH
jgi:hypothetical protein